MLRQPNASCIAWWYLEHSARSSHCFVAVFAHNVNRSLTVCVAEGLSHVSSFAKDDYIAKQGVWDFKPDTTRKTLARVLNYAHSITRNRLHRGFVCGYHSFNQHTGTSDDVEMEKWCDRFNADRFSSSMHDTPRPMWWPTVSNLPWSNGMQSVTRVMVASCGYDLLQLCKEAPRERRRKKSKNAYRRVGRFTVCEKNPNA